MACTVFKDTMSGGWPWSYTTSDDSILERPDPSEISIEKLVPEMDGQQVSDAVEEFFRRIIRAQNQWPGSIHLVGSGQREIVKLVLQPRDALQGHGLARYRWRGPVIDLVACPGRTKLT
jgi:hypothetical protein